MGEIINIRIGTQLKQKLSDKKVNMSEVARRALEMEVNDGERDIIDLRVAEEESWEQWVVSLNELYDTIQQRTLEKERLTLKEIQELEGVWGELLQRMKTRDQLMEELPDLKELTYDDIFNFEKLLSIVDKNRDVFRGRIGLAQIREGILFREVLRGNFKNIQEANEKFKLTQKERAQKFKEEIDKKLDSDEFRKEYFIKQEELRLEEEKKRRLNSF